LRFRYRVIRAWEQPVEAVLEGGLGTLPMAPLAAIEPTELGPVLRRIQERLGREAPPPEADQLRAATRLLMGLRFPREVIEEAMNVMPIYLEDSSTYQLILERGLQQGLQQGVERGRAIEARSALLRVGQRRFGVPDEGIRRAIEAVDDLGRL